MSADDDNAIRTLLGRTALLADEGSVDDYRLVYTDDATWTAGDVKQTGIVEIMEASRQRRDRGVVGPASGNRHLVAPMTISVDGAAAVSYFLFVGAVATTPVLRKFAVYVDESTRTPDGWRITRRESRAG